MGLGAALTDRAKIVGTSVSTERIEGTKVSQKSEGPWFRARLDLSPEDESSQDSGYRRRQMTPTLMLSKRDSTGGKIIIKGKDQLLVKSNQILEQTGGAEDTWLFEVKGRPGLIRKRRAVMGYICNLVKVEATDKRK